MREQEGRERDESLHLQICIAEKHKKINVSLNEQKSLSETFFKGSCGKVVGI